MSAVCCLILHHRWLQKPRRCTHVCQGICARGEANFGWCQRASMLLPICAQFCYANGDSPYAKFLAFLPVCIRGVPVCIWGSVSDRSAIFLPVTHWSRILCTHTYTLTSKIICGPEGRSLYCLNLNCRAPPGRFFRLDLTGWCQDVWPNSYVDSTRFGFFTCAHCACIMFSTQELKSFFLVLIPM